MPVVYLLDTARKPEWWLRDKNADDKGGGKSAGYTSPGPKSVPVSRCVLEKISTDLVLDCSTYQEETMKQLALLLCVVAYVGHGEADDRQKYRDAVQDFLGLLESDIAPSEAGGSNNVNEANDFIDVVLLQRMPMLIRDTPGLYPTAPLPPFTFKVYKTAITNRDLKVNVTRGGIKNFDTAVRRVGDCDPKVVAGNTSVTCVISFDGIASDMVAVTKGDNLQGTIKDVGVQAVVYNTTGTMEVTAARNRPGFVRTFFVEHVKLEVTPGDNLDLNAVRMSNFKSYIANYLREELYLNLYGNYQTLLNYAVATMNFSML